MTGPASGETTGVVPVAAHGAGIAKVDERINYTGSSGGYYYTGGGYPGGGYTGSAASGGGSYSDFYHGRRPC